MSLSQDAGGDEGLPVPQLDGSLAEKETALATRYRNLERSLLRLADLMSASDPQRAALLRSAFERSSTLGIGERLEVIASMLEEGQFIEARSEQTDALGRMRQILELLESGDADRRRSTAKEEIKAYLLELDKLIARQREIGGSTEAGGDAADLAQRQDALGTQAADLATEIGGFAERMSPEPRDEEGEPSEGREGAEAEQGEGGESEQREGGQGDAQQGTAEPQGEQGAEPQGEQGAEPQGEQGAEPQGEQGVEPQGEQGVEPQGEQGVEPQGEQGAEPQGEGSDAASPAEGGQPSEPGQQGSEGSEGEETDPEQIQGDDDASRAKRTKARLESARRRMERAGERLEDAKRREATEEQERALEELENARAELEEILRQLREEEVERLLVQLEARLRKMLRMQRGVLAGLDQLVSDPSAGTQRERELEAVRLGREQQAVAAETMRALLLVRDDGSAVAIPEALEQVQDDATQAARRLERNDTGSSTQGLVRDLVASLEEILDAVEKVQREQEERQQQQGQGEGRPAEPGEMPLVDKLSELKMLRTLQMRINTRTKRYAALLADGVELVEEPELLDALGRLSLRQRKIERAAHGIVSGRTE